jgi:hypothetical protein
MLGESGAGELRIARLERLDDLEVDPAEAVSLGEGAGVDDAADDGQAGLELFVEGVEAAVAGAAHDQAVELAVEVAAGEVGGLGRLLGVEGHELLGDGAQGGKLVVGEAEGGDLGGGRLDDDPNVVQLADVPGRERGDVGATAWGDGDQAVGGEAVERVADRRDRDAERLGELAQGEPSPGRQLALEDPVADGLVRALGELIENRVRLRR